MAKLAVYITDQPAPDVKIADGNALLDHFTWPQNVTASVIAESMGSCLRCRTNNYHPPLTLSSHKMCVRIVTFMFLDESHELSERKGANTPLYMSLSSRQHSRHDSKSWGVLITRKYFPELLSKCSMGEGIETGERYRDYDLEEADITMVSYALEKLSNGAKYLRCNCMLTLIHTFTHCWEKKQAIKLRWFRLWLNSFVIFMEKRDIFQKCFQSRLCLHFSQFCLTYKACPSSDNDVENYW